MATRKRTLQLVSKRTKTRPKLEKRKAFGSTEVEKCECRRCSFGVGEGDDIVEGDLWG